MYEEGGEAKIVIQLKVTKLNPRMLRLSITHFEMKMGQQLSQGVLTEVLPNQNSRRPYPETEKRKKKY